MQQYQGRVIGGHPASLAQSRAQEAPKKTLGLARYKVWLEA
jgi:hypothetical protein